MTRQEDVDVLVLPELAGQLSLDRLCERFMECLVRATGFALIPELKYSAARAPEADGAAGSVADRSIGGGAQDSGREEAEGWDLEVGREAPPPPLYAMVPRVGYLEALEGHVRRAFAPSFPGRGARGGSEAAADGRELWFEADGQPLRWQYPGDTHTHAPPPTRNTHSRARDRS